MNNELKRAMDRKRLTNYEEEDYIIIDGKKQLNPEWEKARIEKVAQNSYFRCPKCNQGSIFIMQSVFVDIVKYIIAIDPLKINNERSIYIIPFNIATPILKKAKDSKDAIALLLTNSDKQYKVSYQDFYTTIKEIKSTNEYKFCCLHCLNNIENEKDIDYYFADSLIKKYLNPVDENCDYENICNVCGSQITSTIIPEKNPETGLIKIITKIMCSDELCNFDYTKQVNENILGKAEK